MESRKIQVTGGSTYIVSLPKEWILKNNLHKNDSVMIFQKRDGSLIIFPGSAGIRKSSKKVIEVTYNTPSGSLFRALVGAYMTGFSEIEIKSRDFLSPVLKREVRNFTNIAIGVEIVEEKRDSILVKDLLNPREIPLLKALKRMYEIGREMHRDAILSLQNQDCELLEDVIARDYEVDRLYWLIAREYLMLRDNPQEDNEEMSVSLALHSFVLSRYIERIGDHAVRIAKSIRILLQNGYDDSKGTEEIKSAEEYAIKIFEKAMTCFFSKSLSEANETIGMVDALIPMCKGILTLASKKGGSQAISLAYISESIRRLGEYSADIAENTINYIMECRERHRI